MIGRLVWDRNETGGGKRLRMEKRERREKEGERDEHGKLVCFIRCRCGGGEMRYARGGTCGKRMPRTLYQRSH
jgi:hypothetical protein